VRRGVRQNWLIPALALVFLAIAIMPGAAQEDQVAAAALTPAPPPVPLPRNSVAVFFGVYDTSFWARSFSVANVGYEPNFIVALISERTLLSTSWGLRIGHESGIALRFGREFSFEIWRGITISFRARLLGGTIVTPRIVIGLSSISNPIGVERDRENEVPNGDVNRLVYLGSELARSLEALPYVEVFYRLHHRSGALGFWGNVAAGHNANGVGIRFWY
jgi:hypothetical protein